jgi:hypothetical protein
MTDLHKTAQQALEALELAQTDVHWELNSPTRKFLRKAEKNLRAALAEPVEPVPQPGVWMHPWPPVRAQQAEPVAWAGYDLDGMVEAFSRVIEAHHSSKHPFHNPIDTDAKMALRILRGFIPSMKAYAATPQRKPLTDEEIDVATAQERDALLDHIYEYGTAAEGVLERIRKLCRAAAEIGRNVK